MVMEAVACGVFFAVETVILREPVPAELNVVEELAGSPETPRATVPVKPPNAATVMVNEAALPALTL